MNFMAVVQPWNCFNHEILLSPDLAWWCLCLKNRSDQRKSQQEVVGESEEERNRCIFNHCAYDPGLSDSFSQEKAGNTNKEICSLVLFWTKENTDGVVYEKIPKLPIICFSNIFIACNVSPRSGFLYISYPANSAAIDIPVGIMNLRKSFLLILKYIFPYLLTE